MTLIRITLILLALGFTVLCLHAGLNGHFMQEFQTVMGLYWGFVAISDLYLGMILFGIIVLIFERSWIALPIIIATFLLGFWICAIWLALRLPEIVRRLDPKN